MKMYVVTPHKQITELILMRGYILKRNMDIIPESFQLSLFSAVLMITVTGKNFLVLRIPSLLANRPILVSDL